MIAEVSHPAVIWRSRACPAIVGPGTPLGPGRRAAATRQVRHPLGCHRPRIADRVVFDKLIQVLVFGCGHRRIADHTCSATTLRRRRVEWINAGVAERLRLEVLAA
jgi:transposase